MATTAYIISIQPPAGMGDRFDIPEDDFAAACITARRYRQRGWGASIVGGGSKWCRWRIDGRGLATMHLVARSADEALMVSRRYCMGYDTIQRED